MAVAVSNPTPSSPADLRSSPRKRRKEALAKGFFKFNAWLSIGVSILIVASVAGRAFSFAVEVDTSSLLEIGWFPRRGLYDVPTLIIGTMIVSLIAMAVAVPLGLGSAVYLSEYASPKVRRTVKPILEMLAGVPSVVLGYFAISFITPELLTRINSDVAFFNLLSAGIAVGVLTLPLVASVSEDAMRSVPMALREAAYGVGARKITVSTRVVFPAAISGIVAAGIIGLSRAIGETMVVAIASGATGGSLRSWDIWSPGQTMTAAMAALGVGTDQVAGDTLAFQSLYFVGALLFLMTFALNIFGDRLVRRIRERY
ncbi:MAG TPA: phosphate ABC transporter permease subunit PstC [Acidimicrobiales bacterium]|nr:phosphate ABC transporter permease subunit PstC [Acidimicrobiales bacterium]